MAPGFARTARKERGMKNKLRIGLLELACIVAMIALIAVMCINY